jgi:hypothetical protein
LLVLGGVSSLSVCAKLSIIDEVIALFNFAKKQPAEGKEKPEKNAYAENAYIT